MRKLVTALLVLLLLQLSQTTFAQKRAITGTVLSEDNTPVSGATVLIKGSTTGTQTDASGHFTIEANKGDILVISAIGFSPQEKKVENASHIGFNLQSGDRKLEEVVVTALGIKKDRKALGYSVTELDSKELMKNKNTNVINSLAGKVPGVNITQFSGAPGAGATITLRGGTSP